MLYLALEGGHGIKKRVAAWKQARGLNCAPAPFAIVPVSVDLLRPEADTPRVIESAKQYASTLSVPLRMLVVDTLSRAIAGGNENNPEDMTAFVRNVDLIRTALPAHVCTIHHSGKDTAKGARGHSSLRAATDTEIEVSSNGSIGSAVAKVTKQRDLDGLGDLFPFHLDSVKLGEDRRGKPVTSCVVRMVTVEQSQEEIADQAAERKREKARREWEANKKGVLEAIKAGAATEQMGETLTGIRQAVHLGMPKVKEAIASLVESGEVEECEVKKAGQAAAGYRPKSRPARPDGLLDGPDGT